MSSEQASPEPAKRVNLAQAEPVGVEQAGQVNPEQVGQVNPEPRQPIGPEQVRHVAKLARLALPESDIPRFSRQLASILEYVAHVSEAPTAGIEPMAHPLPLHNVFREDVVTEPLSIEDVLRNAPQTDGRFFRVPKVIGGDDDSAG